MKNMNAIKNIYLTILTIITILCIVLGSVHFFSDTVSDYDDDLDHDDASHHFYSAFASNTVQAQLEDFDSIDIDVYCASLEIRIGASYGIEMAYPKRYMPNYRVDDGTLTVKQDTIDEDIGIESARACDITITLPSNVALRSVSIDAPVGDIELYGITAESLIVDANIGDVDMESCRITECRSEADMGDIDVSESRIDNGNYTAAMGDIDLEGQFASVTARCSMGAIEIECPDPANSRFDLSCSMGDIEINGRDYGNTYIR